MKGVLIGAGFFAHFQAEAWKRMPAVELAAVADVAFDKATEFATQYAIPEVYFSAEEMLDVERPDFVDIATRPDTHFPLAKLAAQRGIHVITQKPMASSWQECHEMVDVCDRAGVRLLVHENWRWQPWYREAKKRIAAGELGKLAHLEFDWRTGDGVGDNPYQAQPYFRDMPRLIIHESLVHILDTFRFLSGELNITHCETQRMNPLIAGEDWAEIKVHFDSGASGFVHGDRLTGPFPAPVAMGEMKLVGTDATLRIRSDGFMFLRPNGGEEQQLPFIPTTTGYKGDSVYATQQHFVDCLRTGQRCESEGRDYLRTVALVEDAYSAAKP